MVFSSSNSSTRRKSALWNCRRTSTTMTTTMMCTMTWSSLTILLLWSLVVHQSPLILLPVQAYSTGAGSCIGGQAAVGGSHLDAANGRTVQSGELYQGSVTVTLSSNPDVPLVPQPTTAATLQTQTDYTVTVTATRQDLAGYKGILIRLGSNDADVSFTILPTDAAVLKDATACQDETVNAAGVTHVDNSEKRSVSATIRFDAPTTAATLDITIVGANIDTASIYGYNGFVLTVEGEAAVVTDAPTLAPTDAPVASLKPGETLAPTLAPTVSDIMGTLSPTYDVQSDAVVADGTPAAAPTMPLPSSSTRVRSNRSQCMTGLAIAVAALLVR